MIKLNRKHAVLKKMTKEEDNYMDASPAQRVAVVWELTREIWSLKDKKNVERRLQRNITRLIRKRR